jgi:ATP-dependent RNA helicase HelY
LRAAARADQVRREIGDVERRIATHTESLSVRFDRVLEVLALGDFVEGWSLTARGRMLAGLYHECDLLVAEALYDGLLDGLDEAELAALVSCFTYEHRSKFPAPTPRFPSSVVRERFDAIAAAGRRLVATERRLGLTETREPDAAFVDLAHSWATGAPLDDLLDDDLSPGDFVRNMKQLVDLLRQIGELASIAATCDVAREAAGTLLRGVVAAATAVGEGPGLPVDDDVDAASEDAG